MRNHNADQGGAVAAELSRRIQLAYEWDSIAEPAPRGYRPPVERVEITVAEEVLRAYVGEYQLTPQLSLTMTLENGRLEAQPTKTDDVSFRACQLQIQLR